MYVGIQKQHVLHLKYIQFLFCYFKKNIVTGLSWWFSRKDFCLQCRRRSFEPWVGKFPQGRKWQTLSSILALEIPWTEEFGRLRSTGSKSIGHNLVTKRQPCLEPLPWFLLQFYLLLPLLQNKVKMTSNMLVLWWKECCLQGQFWGPLFQTQASLGPTTPALFWNSASIYFMHMPLLPSPPQLHYCSFSSQIFPFVFPSAFIPFIFHCLVHTGLRLIFLTQTFYHAPSFIMPSVS